MDLQRLLDHFNIDVDNPINVMTQDASRKFLHSGTNKARSGPCRAVRKPCCQSGGNGQMRAARFLTPRRRASRRAGPLPVLHQRAAAAGDPAFARLCERPAAEHGPAHQGQGGGGARAGAQGAPYAAHAAVLAAEPSCPAQRNQLDEELAQFAEFDTQRELRDNLRKRLAWTYVSEAEAKVQEAEAKVEECKEKLPRVEKAIASAEEKLNEAAAEKAAKTKAVADYTAASAATVDERKAAVAAASRARKAEEDARRQVSATQRERDLLNRKAARLTEARETARQTQQRETQAETSAADAHVARARAAFEQAKQAYERVKAEEQAAIQALEEARSRVENMQAGDDDIVREEREARDVLRRLQSAQSDGLTAFGDKMPALVRGVPEIRSGVPCCLASLTDTRLPSQRSARTLACSAPCPSAPWVLTCAYLTTAGAWWLRRPSATC